MNWTISFDEEKRIATIETSGIADQESSLQMVKAVVPIFSQKQVTRILIDHTQIEAVSGKVSDIYYRPKEMQEIGVVRPIKIAEVIKPEHEEHFNFMKLVFLNRGFTTSIFYDRPSAMEWLLE